MVTERPLTMFNPNCGSQREFVRVDGSVEVGASVAIVLRMSNVLSVGQRRYAYHHRRCPPCGSSIFD